MKLLYNKAGGSHFLQLLSDPPLRSFILSVAFSQMAINMANVVVIFLVYYLSKSNLLVSLLVLSFIIPQIVLSFVGGVMADLQNKKTILLYGNILRALLFVLLFFNTKSLIFIYVITFLVSVITQFYIPAETPMIPKLVQKKFLTAANSIFSIALFGSILVGYLIAGPLISLLGRSHVFIFIAALFFISGYFIYKIPEKFFLIIKEKTDYSVAKVKYSVVHELQKTYLILVRTSKVTGPFLFLIFSQVIILMLATVIPGYANSILEVKAEELSLLLFGPGALGMMIASFLIGELWAKVKRAKLMTIGLFVSGIILCLFPLTSRIVTRQIVYSMNAYLPHIFDITAIHFAVMLSFFAGFANALLFIPSQTIIQEQIPENFRSKVYGLMFGLVGLFSLLPIIITGGLADVIGVGSVLFILGGIIIIIGVLRLLIHFSKAWIHTKQFFS